MREVRLQASGFWRGMLVRDNLTDSNFRPGISFKSLIYVNTKIMNTIAWLLNQTLKSVQPCEIDKGVALMVGTI